MKVLLIGATGATGSDVLDELLVSEAVHEVVVFVRRKIAVEHEKLSQHVIDFDQPEDWKTQVTGDVLISCLGTTLKTAGSKEEQWKIDYEYQFLFAKIARENEVSSYILISASNASSKSSFFYPKMKGQLEEAIKALHFQRLVIFRPPLLIRKNTDRKMEIWGAKVIHFFNKIGLLRSQKPLSTKSLARAVMTAIEVLKKGEHLIEGQDIPKLAEESTAHHSI